MTRKQNLPNPPPPKAWYDREPRADKYRPRSRSPRPSNNMYQFRGNRSGNHDDNYSPVQSYIRSPRHYEVSTNRHRGESYRPDSYESHEFSFKVDSQLSVDHDHNRMANQYTPPRTRSTRSMHRTNDPVPDRYGTEHNGRRHNRTRDRSPRGRRGFPKTYERPFLQSDRAPTPEILQGMDADEKPGIKYRALEDMSDSDEAEMDICSDEESGQLVESSEEPKKKQARTELKIAADDDSIPRWSNPDPYTTLPPMDLQRRKMDVVKLIRKARVVSNSDSTQKTEAVTDDFISFDLDDLDARQPPHPKGPIRRHELTRSGELSNTTEHWRPHDNISNLSSDPNIGSRKRAFDNEARDMGLLLQNPLKNIRRAWEIVPGINPTPWCIVDHSATLSMGHWLHKEIMDFYHHVRPTDFENSIRLDLVDRLRSAVKKSYKDADIRPFGSFVAGLYLPTADMDLVMVSQSFLNRGWATYHRKDFLSKFGAYLDRCGLVASGSMEIIHKAKVPLVKYVDKITGIKVDISFENMTGIVANETFKCWNDQYPAMSILVTLIKQFLAMRGLNEPVNGGIGGFSVTCLVVSLLQHMPQVQSGNLIPEHHLGEVLMEFFNLYGNEFNAVTMAIRFNPPGLIAKDFHRDAVPRRAKNQIGFEKLSIIDPNNRANDIAGGSKKTPTILRAFAEAYRELQRRMATLQAIPIEARRGVSILGVVLGGDYSSFATQRERLWDCYLATGSRE